MTHWQIVGLVCFLVQAFGAGFVIGFAMGRRHENVPWRCYHKLQAIEWGADEEGK